MKIWIGDGPGNMPLGRCLQEQADAEREFGRSPGHIIHGDCAEAVSEAAAAIEPPESAT